MSLRLDWATSAAAKYACGYWHYSGTVPAGPAVRVGAWEEGRFIGVVLFGTGTGKNLGKPYGLESNQACELTRIALTEHKAPVSRIGAIAIRFLRRKSPGLRIIVSFADPAHGHHGGIYQAMGWIYSGVAGRRNAFMDKRGNRLHDRLVTPSGYCKSFGGKIVKCSKVSDCVKIRLPAKHRYLFPLDRDMAALVSKLSKPYPKRQKHRDDVPAVQAGEGGLTPTLALQ